MSPIAFSSLDDPGCASTVIADSDESSCKDAGDTAMEPPSAFAQMLNCFAPEGKLNLSIGDSSETVDRMSQSILKAAEGQDDTMKEFLARVAENEHPEQAARSEANKKKRFRRSALGEYGIEWFFFNTGGAAGNPIAGRWQRYLKANPSEKATYDALKGSDAKHKIRQGWCKARFDEYHEKKHSRKRVLRWNRSRAATTASPKSQWRREAARQGNAQR